MPAKYPVGHELRVFVDPQTDFATRAADAPVGADAVLCRSVSVTPSRPSEPGADRYGKITEVDGYEVEMAHGAEWSMEADVNLSGAIGTDSDLHDLLTSGGWTQDDGGGSLDTTANGSNSHTATASTIGVASTTTVVAGDAVAIATTSGTYLRRVTSVSSGTSITVSPPLVDSSGELVDPDSADTVKSVAIYSVNQDRTDAEAFTMWATYEQWADVLTGCATTQETWSLSPSQTATLACSGFAQKSAQMGFARLDGAINNTVTSIDVDWAVLSEDALPAHYLIGSEVVEVVAISSDGLTWTVTRGDALGGSAASHSDGDELYPYRPSPTYATAKVSAKCGAVSVFNDTSLRLQSATVEIDWGIEEDPQWLGSCNVRDGYAVSGKVAVSVSMEALLRRDGAAIMAHQMARRTEGALLMQQGDTAGAMLALYCPVVRLDEPARTTADKVGLSLSGRAIGASLASPSPVYLIVG